MTYSFFRPSTLAFQKTTVAWSARLQRFWTQMKAFFTVIFFIAFFRRNLAGRSCSDHLSEHGFALVDHIYNSFSTDHLFACFIACNMQPACQSFNYDLADKTCQLNNNTRYFRPEYFVEKGSSVYADNPDSGKLQLFHFYGLPVCFKMFFFISFVIFYSHFLIVNNYFLCY